MRMPNSWEEEHPYTAELQSSGIEEVESVIVCVSHVRQMYICGRGYGEVVRLRWQIQRDLCYVPFCSAMANIHKHPLSWTEIC